MAQIVRFTDQVSVSSFGNTGTGDAISLTNATVNSNVITFTKSDNTQFNITVDTGSGGFFNTSSLLITASVAGNVMTFTKGDGNTFDVTLPGSDSAGIFKQIGSTDIFNATSSLQITGSTLLSSPLTLTGANITASNNGSGGEVDKYTLVTSESAWHYNTNVGVPTSQGWKTGLDGSYFDRFDQNTDTSEVLRFIAGLLKDQAPDSSPNTQTWNAVSTNYSGESVTSRNSLFQGVLGSSFETSKLSQHWTASSYINFNNTASYKLPQEYYIAKGFIDISDRGVFGNDTGTNPFSNEYGSNFPTGNEIIIQSNFNLLSFENSSIKAGTTTVSSSNAVELFGMGTLNSGGTAKEISVEILSSQSYSDNATNTTPNETLNNYHTSSLVSYSQAQFGVSADGLRLGKIIPSNPQISSQYQDGLFASVDGPITGRFYTGGSTNQNNISSSGFYIMHGVKVGLKTGSMVNFEYKNGSNSNASAKFYMPNPYNASFTTEGALQDITNGTPVTTINDTLTRTAFSATSRSLSGAPYLLTTTYNFTYNAEVSKSFDAAYNPNIDPMTINLTDQDTWTNVGTTTPSSPLTVDINSNGINTSIANAGVFPIGGNPSTRRNLGVIPHINDIAYISSSLSFTLNSNTSNSSTPVWNTNTNYNLRFNTTGRNWKGSSNQTSTTPTQLLYNSTLFNQPASSGSMAIYSYAQGYDAGQETSTAGGVLSETFSGEDFRVKINSNTLNGTFAAADKFNTDSFTINNLTEIDFQVKPGHLVVPGGTNGYWLPTIGSSTYKYYARAFSAAGFGGIPAKSFTLNIGKQFQNLKRWYEDVNENGISIGVIFQSGTNSVTGNKILIDLLDYTNINSSFNNITPQAGLNPFGTNIDIFTNNNTSSPNNTDQNIPLGTSLGKFTEITNVTPSFIVCIRGNNVSNDYINQIIIQLSSS